MDENHGHRFSPRPTPFDTSISRTTDPSLFYRTRLPLRRQNSYLYQESVDSLFSRLHISDPDHQYSIWSQDYLFAGSQPEIRRNVRTNGVSSSYLQPRLQDYDYVNYSEMLPPSNIGLLDNSLYGIPRFKNIGGILGSDSGRTSVFNRMPNCSAAEHLPLQYLRGKIVSLARDQSGCRLVQKTIENASTVEIDLVLWEVIEHVAELMIDPCGNYVVQKLIDVCTKEQRSRILVSVTRKEFQLVTICLNTHGTRAVQKLLERINSPQEVSIVMSALGPGAVALTKDINGHHVIKHCLDHFSVDDNKCLLDVITKNCFEIATDKSGCCVLQQCVERCHGETRDALVAEITARALLLSEHQFGNYVVQHILGLRVPRITSNILRQLKGHFATLSCNKYGSNVVEKCLSESNGEQSTQIVLELLSSPNFCMVLVDPYGNFVIQAALSVSIDRYSKCVLDKHPSQENYVEQRVVLRFLQLIQENGPFMRNNIYGKKVLAWLHKNKVQYM